MRLFDRPHTLPKTECHFTQPSGLQALMSFICHHKYALGLQLFLANLMAGNLIGTAWIGNNKTRKRDMHEFKSIGEFVKHLATVKVAEGLAVRSGLKRAAKLVEKQAKAEIGHYQKSVGPFQAWPELAESTREDRVQKGFTENDPLLRTGGLRDSISHQVSGLEAVIGSSSQVALWQELGTPKMPPRPFLGTALAHKEKQVVKLIGDHTVSALIDGRAFSYPLRGTASRASE